MRAAPFTAALALAGALTLVACSSGGSSTASDTSAPASTPTPTSSSKPTSSALKVVKDDPASGQFGDALAATGVGALYGKKGTYTFFVPQDTSFARIPAAQLKALKLPCNKAALTKIARFHIVPGTAPTTLSPATLKTLEGETLTVETGAGRALINGQAFVQTNPIPVTNGVVYQTSGLLIPKSVDLAKLPTKC